MGSRLLSICNIISMIFETDTNFDRGVYGEILKRDLNFCLGVICLRILRSVEEGCFLCVHLVREGEHMNVFEPTIFSSYFPLRKLQ